MAESRSDSTPNKELRIGLVLYGGVSLAVYMNGIVTEIWNALRASRNIADDGALPGGASAEVYSQFLEDLAAHGCIKRLQIVVDTVAGTSAGAINATVLAKAIVEGGDARVLNEMWIEGAGIEHLRAEPRRRIGWRGRWLVRVAGWLSKEVRLIRSKVDRLPGIGWEWLLDQLHSMRTARDGGHSPLDGGYFSRVIARALSGMASNQGPPLISDYQRFDLFLPQTDIHGWPRHLPVSRLYHPDMLYERTHAHVMSFVNCDGKLRHEFALTYGTRASAGFPFAFAPAGYQAVARALHDARLGEMPRGLPGFARRHLREHELAGPGFPPERAWMIDGGILDNKPFSHVAPAIERKPAVCEVHRVVVYIEPSPEGSIKASPASPPPPAAVLGGVWRLFRHRPIYDDLRRLEERNRKARRIREVVEAARVSLRIHLQSSRRRSRSACFWSDECWVLRSAGCWQQPNYPGYVALSSRSAARKAAGAVCRALEYPRHSRQAYFVHGLARAWLDSKGWLAPARFDEERQHYRLGAGQFEFLHHFDVSIRRRWLRSLVAVANCEFKSCDDREADRNEISKAIDSFKRGLASVSELIDRIEAEIGGADLAILERLLAKVDIDLAIAGLHNDSRRLAIVERFDGVMTACYRRMVDQISGRWDEVSERVINAVTSIPARGRFASIRNELWGFRNLDQIAFPLMDSADIAELIEIDVMRISPSDSVLFSHHVCPLKGGGLLGFSGFLDRGYRENDLLVGRLHGAERMIDLIARAAAPDEFQYDELAALRERYKRRAAEAILADEARRGNDAGDAVHRALRNAADDPG